MNDRHLKRIQDILTDAQVLVLFLATRIALTNKVADTDCAELHTRYAHYERRTSILPVVAYDSLDDAITYVTNDL